MLGWLDDKYRQRLAQNRQLKGPMGHITLLILAACIYTIYALSSALWSIAMDDSLMDASLFDELKGHCAHVSPIGRAEFLARQTALAQTLHTLNASAYVAEPGASAQFFGNISGASWHVSERPLLLIVSPDVQSDGSVKPHVSVLTPAFEETRAKLLPIPTEKVNWVSWAEEVDPYEVAISAIPSLQETKGDIIVDGSIRNFIVDGLTQAGYGAQVRSAPTEIKRLRERKSPAEIELLKCVNEATVLAIRVVRKRMHIGISESETRHLLEAALGPKGAGLEGGYGLVLFGENAALPHGSGSDRTLGEHDFALIDTGGSLHGYQSDVTRTFALDESKISPGQLALWKLVHSAQTAASHAASNGTVTAKVDETARKVITDAGYGKYFTHRLGHGIGIEGHESPYLRGGSKDVIATGHSFSNEPGVYIEGQIGVRLEDCFYVAEDGNPVFFTAGIGGQARSPWDP